MEDSQGCAGHRTSLVTAYVCGAVAGTLTFGLVLVGVLVEVGQLWREGGATLVFSDAAMRLFFGACLGILSAAPYLLLASASRKAGPPMLFATLAVLMLVSQLCFTIYILVFARSSTASIGLLFMPLYLCVPAGAAWVVAALAREAGMRRSAR